MITTVIDSEAQSASERPRPTGGALVAIESSRGCVEQMQVYAGLAVARLHFARQVAGMLDGPSAQMLVDAKAIMKWLERLDRQLAALSKGEEIPS